MPTYEYHCAQCDRRFEIVQSLREHERGRTKCPECGAREVERVFSRIGVSGSSKGYHPAKPLDV